MLICWMNCVPWDYAIVVLAGKLRKLWDSLSELCISVCERRLERTVLRPAALLPVRTARFTQFFPSCMLSHGKIAQFNWECIGRLSLTFKNCASYIYRTGVPLPSKCCILYIHFFPTNISTEYFKHAAHSSFFSSKCRLFHNATFFGSCIIHILHTGCAEI